MIFTSCSQAGYPPLLSFSSSGSWQAEALWSSYWLYGQWHPGMASAAGGGAGKGGKRTRAGERGGNKTKVEVTVQLH